MALESVAEFGERTKELNEDGVEEEMMKITNAAMQAVAQNEPIPSALPSSLLEVINRSYVKHLSPIFGFFGCDQKRKEWKLYEDAYSKYEAEVEEALAEKVASVVKDSTDTESLKEINDHLVIKWKWINKGLFDGQKWSTSTHIPLLTQTVIKNLDSMADEVIGSFEEVR